MYLRLIDSWNRILFLLFSILASLFFFYLAAFGSLIVRWLPHSKRFVFLSGHASNTVQFQGEIDEKWPSLYIIASSKQRRNRKWWALLCATVWLFYCLKIFSCLFAHSSCTFCCCFCVFFMDLFFSLSFSFSRSNSPSVSHFRIDFITIRRMQLFCCSELFLFSFSFLFRFVSLGVHHFNPKTVIVHDFGPPEIFCSIRHLFVCVIFLGWQHSFDQ